MAHLGNLIVNGVARVLSKLYVGDSITAPKFIGDLTGKVNNHTIESDVPKAPGGTDKFLRADGTYAVPEGTGSIPEASDVVSGIAKLYNALGTNKDGAATQAIVNSIFGQIKSFERGVTISASDDWDNISIGIHEVNGKTAGCWTAALHGPVGASPWGYVISWDNKSTRRFQVFITITAYLFIRTRYDGAWTAWTFLGGKLDTALSASSTAAVQNKVITNELSKKVPIGNYTSDTAVTNITSNQTSGGYTTKTKDGNYITTITPSHITVGTATNSTKIDPNMVNTYDGYFSYIYINGNNILNKFPTSVWHTGEKIFPNGTNKATKYGTKNYIVQKIGNVMYISMRIALSFTARNVVLPVSFKSNEYIILLSYKTKNCGDAVPHVYVDSQDSGFFSLAARGIRWNSNGGVELMITKDLFDNIYNETFNYIDVLCIGLFK